MALRNRELHARNDDDDECVLQGGGLLRLIGVLVYLISLL